MTSELSDGGEIATGIAVLPSGNIPNLPSNMPVDLSMAHPQPIQLQQRLQPTAFMNWIPSHLPLQMDPNFDPNSMHHPNQVMAIPYPVPFQNQYFQSPFPQNYSYQPFVTQLDTRYISIPAVNTLPSIQLPSQNTPHDIHPRSDSQGPSPVNISLHQICLMAIPHMFDFNIESLNYPHEYMNAQLQDDIEAIGQPAGHLKSKRAPSTKKLPKAKPPPPKAQPKKQPRGKDDESVDKPSNPTSEVASDLVDDLVIFSAAQSEAVTQPPHIQEQLAKYKVAPNPPGEPSPALFKATHIKGPKVCCALGCEQVITKRRLCARHQKQKERNGGKISLKPEMEVGPTPTKRKKEDEVPVPSPAPSAADMTAAIKLDFTPSTPDKPNGAPKGRKAARKKTSPKKKAKQELDTNETSQLAESGSMEGSTRYGGGMNNGFINNPAMYEANRSMLSQSGSLEDMFQSQEGTDVSEPHSDTS
eukprot:CAMPEP_0168571644 /NCGR_PEP_ID=MMETSP0413-20121227/17464_1 /TAXON_ID=136452 /ORGANISM="Filamoeba nolandi, Strain NC-AS-23-1" /LENGTH=471 /DNA_ID=CAMNT_0008604547 /DNA_START=144 /DNA_END=1556 /DNA_ORIENTATION=+